MFIEGLALERLEQQAISIGFSGREDYNFENHRVVSAGDYKGYSYVAAVFFDEGHAHQWVQWARENVESLSADQVYTEVLKACRANPVTDLEVHVAIVSAYDLVPAGWDPDTSSSHS